MHFALIIEEKQIMSKIFQAKYLENYILSKKSKVNILFTFSVFTFICF